MPAPPPPPSRVEEVVDVLHGVEVRDPYRWLEDGDDPEVVAWVAAQEARTRAALDPLPQRPWAHARLVDLLGVPVSTGCRVAGATAFAVERGGGRPQAVLVARPADDPVAAGRVLVDPAAGGDPTVALDWYHPSPDGRLVAYGTSVAGSELSALRVLDVATGAHLPDVIEGTRAASVGWLPDGTAFAHTRYPVDEAAAGTSRHVRWHVLGDDPADDPVVWDALPDPAAWPDVTVSRDGRHLLVHVAVGWSRTDVHLLDRATGRWTTVIEGVDVVTSLRVAGDRLVGATTLDAPRGRVVAAPLHAPTPDRWTTLVPEGTAVVDHVTVAGPWLLVASTEVAVARLHRLPLAGGPVEEVPLPGPASLAGLDADPGRAVALLQLESFARPPSLHRWTPEAGVEPWGAPADAAVTAGGAGRPVDHDAYVVEQVAYPSTDGTDVPMFLLRARTTTLDARTPALLTGYGGFAVAMSPAWSPSWVAACDAGALVAVAGLRGGAEHGEAWHRAGTRERKPQVFDDFAAAADWLVATGRTSPDRLAIRGGSNGGLLVAATITRRPDLCRAAVAAVPLTDMVRYARFLIGRLWVPEYGDPDVADDLAHLHAYSPYHRVADGACYPATLLTTADRDSRVDPAHARKMAARLQAATACGTDRPVLLRGERRAGHGAGKPLAAQADEAADVLAFVLAELGVAAPPPG